MGKRVADMTPEERKRYTARLAKKREEYARDPAIRAQVSAQGKTYRESSPELCKERARESYRRHAEKRREDSRRWRENNPGYQRAYFAEWKKKNRDRLLNGKADYAVRNPELMASVQSRQRELRKAVAARATVIGVAWTPAEDAIAMDRRHTYIQAAVILGRTPGAVKGRIERLTRKERYPAGRRRKNWSASEDAFIESAQLTVSEMAFALERTEHGVRRRLYYLRKRADESA